MAEKATTAVEELVQAYNQAISSGVAAIDASIAQTTDATKLIGDALQKERVEYGRVWDEAAAHTRKRNENMTSAIPEVFRGMTAAPAFGLPGVSQEARDSVSKIIENEMAFYQAWTKTWMDYLGGMESRRSAAAQALMEGNSKTLASTQDAAKNAVKYGEAIYGWSLDSVNATRS